MKLNNRIEVFIWIIPEQSIKDPWHSLNFPNCHKLILYWTVEIRVEVFKKNVFEDIILLKTTQKFEVHTEKLLDVV